MKTIMWIILAAIPVLAGCGTPSWETGVSDPDVPPVGYRPGEDQAASLIEVTFGGGESEVTKNLPHDAVHGVQDAVKTLRGKKPADVSGPAP